MTWYFRTQFDTQIYRNTDAASPLQTEEDGALVNAMRYAKAKHNLTVAFTPFLDPFCNDYKVSPQRHGIPAAAWYPARHGIPAAAWYPRSGMVSPQRHGIPAAAWYPHTAWYPARHGILHDMVSPHGTVFRTPWGMVSRTA